jgi:biotin operon repressor
VNRAELLLSVLKDGKPHSRRDIAERVGWFLTNNAASELRKRGFVIEHKLVKGHHVYTLLSEGGSHPHSSDPAGWGQPLSESSVSKFGPLSSERTFTRTREGVGAESLGAVRADGSPAGESAAAPTERPDTLSPVVSGQLNLWAAA